MSSYGHWQNFSGVMSLWKVRWWGWNGQSREIDENGDVIESLNTLFVHAFTEEHLEGILSYKYDMDLKKVESMENGSDDEEQAFDSGWTEGWDAREQKVRNAKPRKLG